LATQAPARRTEQRGAASPAVRLSGIRRTYGDVVAIDKLDLDIAEGEFFTLLGPSGSGKTTTLRVIAGFEQPDEGHVELAGLDVTRVPPSERDVNTVFQDYALFPHMTVQENVEYGLRVKGMGRRERRIQTQDVLERVPLASRCSSPVASASGLRLHARSSTHRQCCSSTNRSARSI
jgi:putative spermidine/putrescine transport system ATP-binding protein